MVMSFKMFSVGIIVPTWHYFADPFKLQPSFELYFATVIDSRLADKEVNVHVIDLRVIRSTDDGLCLETIPSYVPKHDLYLYWITKPADYNEILFVVENLRQVYPKAKHVAGGTHVDIFPKDCKKHFDAIVLGPGEESFINVINDCRNRSLNKVYQSKWENVMYSDYPFARRHYLPESAIVNTILFEKYGGIRGTSALFSRGCNFKCAYCIYNVPHRAQFRTPEEIEEEITYLKEEYQIKGVNLRDEMCIPPSPKIAIPYMNAIGRTDLIWRGQTRVGASEELIALAHKTGCVELAIGVESASQQALNIIHKGQTVQQAKDFIKLCKSYDIKVRMCLILGLPGEPKDIVERTISFIEETNPDYANTSGLCPVPGSKMFNNREYYGIKYIDEDWSKHAHLLFRFSDEESFGLPFEYEKNNRWGKTFSRTEIADNIRKIQHYLQDHDMIY